MKYRIATLDDGQSLAAMNHQLLQDEMHSNRFMTLSQLEKRMREFLSGEYRGVIFEENGGIVGYALYREESDRIYLRQLFIVRDLRRRGHGRQAIAVLRSEIWPKDKRLTVDVLLHNTTAISFWRAVGYKDYLLGLEIAPDSPPDGLAN